MCKKLIFLISFVLVFALFGANVVFADAPVAHYKLDETGGTTAADSSGNGYDATISDGAWVAGKYDGALELTGDTVTIPADGIGMTSDSGSVAFWMNADTPSGIGTMFWVGDNTSGNGFGGENEMHIHLESAGSSWQGGELSFWTPTSFLHSDPTKGAAGSTPVDPLILSDQQWHHIAATWGDGSVKLFVDSTLITEAAYSSSGFALDHMYLGSMAAGNRTYNGILDDVRIFDHPLSDAEIVAVMNNQQGGAPVTLDVQISEGNDDAEEHLDDGDMDITSSDLEMPYEYAGPSDAQQVGLRFQGVNIPYGATITSAYIEVEVDETKGGSDPVTVIIQAELAENAAAISGSANNLSSRTLTSASVSWSIPNWTAADEKFQSSDISPVIQEIVNQLGWESGNALLLSILDDPANPSSGIRCAESYDGEASAAPSLHIVYSTGGPPPAIVVATKPEPASGTSDLPRGITLSWEPGEYADAHNVYLGTSMDDVSNATVDNPLDVLVSMEQTDALYNTSGLEYGTSYYWRVDEVNQADMTIYPGNVWSFTTAPIGLIMPSSAITASASSQQYPDEQGPEKTIDGSGLNADNQHSVVGADMWFSAAAVDPNLNWIQYNFDKVYKIPRILLWNYNLPGFFTGVGVKDITIEYSSDGGDTWDTLAGVSEIPQGPGTDDYEPFVIDSGGVADGIAADVIRITVNNTWSDLFGNCGLSEVLFYYVDVWPKEPLPSDGATDIDVATTLSWTPGDGSVEHMLYLGTNEDDVNNGTADAYLLTYPMMDVELTLDTTYFWRVEEVNNAADPSAWSGEIWSFTTTDHIVVDDFESYGNSIGNWRRGGGGAIGAPETSIARNGAQSMKFMYDNVNSTNYSEIRVDPGKLNCGRDWEIGSPKWLVFWVYGELTNDDTEAMYVKINDDWYKYVLSKKELVTPWWTQVTVSLNADQNPLNNVTSLKIGFMKNTPDDGEGVVYIEDIRLYKDAPVPILPVNPGNANLVAYYKMQNNANDSSGNGINGVAMGDPNYVGGPFSAYGKAMEFDGVDDVVDLGAADPFNFTGSFSISFWANINEWDTSSWDWGNTIFATRGEDGMGFQILRAYFGRLSFTTRGITEPGWWGPTEDHVVGGAPALGEWTHLTCVYDADNSLITMYYDDEQVKQASVEGTLVPSTSNASIGARTNADNTGFESFFSGELDDVRVYDKALSASEVRFLCDPTP